MIDHDIDLLKAIQHAEEATLLKHEQWVFTEDMARLYFMDEFLKMVSPDTCILPRGE